MANKPAIAEDPIKYVYIKRGKNDPYTTNECGSEWKDCIFETIDKCYEFCVKDDKCVGCEKEGHLDKKVFMPNHYRIGTYAKYARKT